MILHSRKMNYSVRYNLLLLIHYIYTLRYCTIIFAFLCVKNVIKNANKDNKG